jgi:hypothetical protein
MDCSTHLDYPGDFHSPGRTPHYAEVAPDSLTFIQNTQVVSSEFLGETIGVQRNIKKMLSDPRGANY